MTIRSSVYLFLGITVGLAAGCGPVLVKPKGRIVDNGTPIQIKAGDTLQVVFHALKDGSDAPIDSFIAHLVPDNAFECRGRKGNGVLPGRYRISVEVMDKSGDRDRLQGVFSPDKSPIIRTIADDKEEIVIDVRKPSG